MKTISGVTMDVLILFGSESDLGVGVETTKLLDKLRVSYEIHIASAHRTPEFVRELVAQAEDQGAKTIIAGAGLSAHLAGVVAAETLLPVIGIPIAGGPLNGLDSLFSTVNMPEGIPVATVSLGKAGCKNAALLAARIVALNDSTVKANLVAYRQSMIDGVLAADQKLQESLAGKTVSQL
jgi:5-(carboxyamino)imidazole ribonucleotide mutase